MMKKIFKKLILWLMILALSMPAMGALADAPITISAIQKYGNLVLSISGRDFLAQGYAYGDIVTVTMNGGAYDMPVGSSYSDVDEGSMVCRVVIDPSTGDDYVILAVNMGDLAGSAGIAEKKTIREEPGYRWDYLADVPVEIQFSMKEPAGYLDEFMIRSLVRTNERGDYPHLTDEQFANFRVIETTGMGKNVLYRSSSPVNPELNRNAYADRALKAAGMKTIINLADSKGSMEAYEGFSASAYAGCSVIPLNLGVDFQAADFQSGLAEGLRFLIAQEGPYLLHCTEGKDRAGFLSALLECLMGATLEEVIHDYMTTYFNYYGVEKGSEQYAAVENNNVRHILKTAFGVSELEGANLAKEAEEYLLENLNLTADEVARLKERLGGE